MAAVIVDHVWSAAEAAALLLPASEREVVLGDLVEAGASGWKALRAVIWLRVRREVELWRRWQPWAAGLGLALPSSFLLMGASLGVAIACRRVFSLDGVHSNLAADAVYRFMRSALLMAGLAWCGGQAVALLSRRTLWVSALLCVIPCCCCLAEFRSGSSLSPWCLLLFLVPALGGIAVGLWRGHAGWRAQTGVAVLLTALALAQWRETGFALGALLCSAWYLAASARKKHLQ